MGKWRKIEETWKVLAPVRNEGELDFRWLTYDELKSGKKKRKRKKTKKQRGYSICPKCNITVLKKKCKGCGDVFEMVIPIENNDNTNN